MVTANCLYMSPASPPMNATGMKTAHNTSTMAITGPVTSPMALIAASRGGRPSLAMIRSTFSSTTIASSTTMPIARTSPNRVNRLMENPSMYMPANVPMIEIGTAMTGIRVARRFCRNMKTTTTTRMIASMKVKTTSSIDTSMNFVVS